MTRSVSFLMAALSLAGCDDATVRAINLDAAAFPDAAPPDATSAVPDLSPAPDLRTSLTFAIIGDYGDGNTEGPVATLVKSWNPDFILTVGDNNYPSGKAETIDKNVGQHYASFIGHYQGHYCDAPCQNGMTVCCNHQGSPTNRFWPTLGNHDCYNNMAFDCKPYLDYFPDLPGLKRYYDVEIGPMHLFALNSSGYEPDGETVSSKQYLWLRDQLAASKSCFNVVYHHRPGYSSGAFNDPALRWPFKTLGADIVLAGHEHSYERLEIDGLTYMNNGLGGTDKFRFPNPLPESKVRYNSDFGAQRVTVERGKMVFEFISVKNIVIDTYTLMKDCPL